MSKTRSDGGPTEYVRCSAADCRIQTEAYKTTKEAAAVWHRRRAR